MAHKLAINGGKRSSLVEWPSWPVWGDEERRTVGALFDSGNLWRGPKVAEFEEKFAAFQDAKYGVTACNGSLALESALLALGVEAGDEVIVPPYTFMATVTSVVRANCIPVFADIDGGTLCIDPDDVERKVTDKTKGIIPVHVGGHVADMDRINQIAKAHNLFVLEDACHSWGSKWRGKGTGTLGDCAAFSFQNSKNITAAEGGITLTDNKDLAELIRSYTNCGRQEGKPWYWHACAGTNMRLTDIQAAILLVQLERLEHQGAKREANAKVLTAGLGTISGIDVMRSDPRITQRAYHFYSFRVNENILGISRDVFLEALNAEGIPATSGYTMPLYQAMFMKSGDDQVGRGCHPYAAAERDYEGVTCPVCEKACATTVWLKHHVLLADEDAMRDLVNAVEKICENASELRQLDPPA